MQSDQGTEEVQQGERVARSPISGCFYLVTKWIDHGDGNITALQKEEISDAEVVEKVDGELPEAWREQIEQDLWHSLDEQQSKPTQLESQ
jgi:hypothetical protein